MPDGKVVLGNAHMQTSSRRFGKQVTLAAARRLLILPLQN